MFHRLRNPTIHSDPTTARHWSLLWGRCNQYTPFNPTAPRFILILSFVNAWFFQDVSSLRVSNQILYEFLIFPCVLDTSSIRTSMIWWITSGENCKLWSSSLSYFIQPSALPSLLRPSILIILFSKHFQSVIALILQIKLHTHTEPSVKCWHLSKMDFCGSKIWALIKAKFSKTKLWEILRIDSQR
jgi:hypothetical protein